MSDGARSKETSRLGLLLVEKGLITERDLQLALQVQQQEGKRLGEVLVSQKLITRTQLTQVLCKQKWLRSAVAGLLIAAAPVCPALASEKPLDFGGKTKLFVDKSPDKINFSGGTNFEPDSKFSVGLKHRFDFGPSVEVRFNQGPQFDPTQPANFAPQISFASGGRSYSDKKVGYRHSMGPKRFDRYKDTIPAIYRLTIKGYSIYEKEHNTVETWGMNKVKSHPCKDYELMFSVTKHF
ncbi:MAG: hypothetical protein OQJ89_10960 [Kangiellaceae bacterium]|nr:hypothetical protein [Kangiellaceae bacterium]MCW9017477.1 hypothetical protein [Kangiellaceae bacterium]